MRNATDKDPSIYILLIILLKIWHTCNGHDWERIRVISAPSLPPKLPYDVGPARAFLGEAEKTPWLCVVLGPASRVNR